MNKQARKELILQLIDLAAKDQIVDSNQVANLVSFELSNRTCILYTFKSERAAYWFLDSINSIQMAILDDEFGFESEVLDP